MIAVDAKVSMLATYLVADLVSKLAALKVICSVEMLDMMKDFDSGCLKESEKVDLMARC